MRKPKLNKSTTKIKAGVHEGAKQYGWPIIRTSQVVSNQNDDPKVLVTESDRNELVNVARYYYENVGSLKGAIDEISNFAVGSGYVPVFHGEDTEWNKQAEEWLTNWFKVCDPMQYDFATDLWISSTSIDRDGDILMYLTTSRDGKFPRISFVPAHRIKYKQNKKTIEEGPFTGYDVIDGVIVDGNTPIGYAIQVDETNYTTVSTQDAIMLFEAKYPLQLRGFPTIAATLNDWYNYRNIKDWEKFAIEKAASIALIEKNELGGPDPSDYFSTGSIGPDAKPIFYQYYQGGTIKYFGSNDPNAGITQMENNRPGADTATFIKDHILRGCFNNLGIPLEIAHDMNGMNSANVRAILAKVKRKLIVRQATLTKAARMACRYALAKAIKSGYLPSNKDWYKFDFVLPPHPSIDMGRDANADINYYKIGANTLSDMWGEDGANWEKKIRQLCYEKKRIKEISSEYGIDPAEIQTGIFNGNVQPPQSKASDPVQPQ